MLRKDVYELIDGEREYQNSFAVGPDGRTDGKEKSVGDYLTLIRVYSAKADESYSGNPGNIPALEMVRKIAAIAVQCMEVYDTPARGK